MSPRIQRYLEGQPQGQALLLLAIAFITSMYGVSVFERAELSSQVAELKDLTKRSLLDLQPVKFAKYTVVNPEANCSGLLVHTDYAGSVEWLGI
jgi:hypothetical protein